VDVVSAGNVSFEVTLDSRKLKTPGGSVLTIENEALALAVSHEWQSQQDTIQVNGKRLFVLLRLCFLMFARLTTSMPLQLH
jgi:chaperone required for assembly of F1-ATPase